MMTLLGVMTGTSCDGLDMCCISASPKEWHVLWQGSVPFPSELRKKVLLCQVPRSKITVQDLLHLDRDLGVWMGRSIQTLLAKKIAAKAGALPDLIALHGQTIAHHPSVSKKQTGVTLQLTDPSCVAQQTGLTVLSHFRNGDIAAGGQGAPLAPLFHKALIKKNLGISPGVAIHNLGGISNLTYVGPDFELLAWDTGPANLWIDAAVESATRGKWSFDRAGKLAASGQINAKVIEKLKKHPYLKKSPPKSTGRDDFPSKDFLKNFRKKDQDMIATATRFTAETIAQDYRKWILNQGLPLKAIYFSGGGAKNPTLLKMIQELLPKIQISTIAAWGIDPQYVEAEAFAVLGLASLLGNPLGGSWTGMSQVFSSPAWITPGKNWPLITEKITGFLKSPPTYL